MKMHLFHRWEPQGVSPSSTIWFDCNGTELGSRSMTDVLLVCSECGEVRTRKLAGDWTIEQVRKT